MKTLAFFNNKGGVGKTTLVYHLAWMFQELGVRVAALDLDPQANLTAAFLPEERLEELWLDRHGPRTILGLLRPLLQRLGDIGDPPLEAIGERLWLLPGDLGLSLAEDRLAEAWPKSLPDNNPFDREDAIRVTSAFYRAADRAAQLCDADLALIDVGPSLGALNRAALIACDFVVMPLGADLYSLQGLRNLGPTLKEWRRGWQLRRGSPAPAGLRLPAGEMEPIGYVVLQHAVRKDRPVRAYERWVVRIPAVYHQEILGETFSLPPVCIPDSQQLASLKHYRSLMPLAQDARKPMFLLTAADGALGSHARAVFDCYQDFQNLALRIAAACGLSVSQPASPGA